ncbi:tetratricopeptide repeat protein [Rhodohalobacter sp.]|uniref:ATP-binding protein n=1 Tax=Rhodohalobacter sp. TaxID=1974210 RepID=UPI003566E7B0
MRVLLCLHILLFLQFLQFEVNAQQADLDSLRSVVNPAISSMETVESINELGEQLVMRGEFTEARDWHLLAFQVADRLEAERDLAQFQTLVSLGSLYLSKEKPDSALIMLDQAGFLNVPAESMNSQKNLKAVALQMSGQLVLSSNLYEEAIHVADSLGRGDQVAGLRMNLASVYSSMGEEVVALRNFYDALVFAEDSKDSVLIAVTSNNIGHLFNEMEDYEQAEFYLDNSEEISRNIGHQVNLRRVFVNKGNLYSGQGRYDLAEEYYTEGLDLAEAADDRLAEVRIYYNLARMEAQRGDRSRAEEIFLFSLEESVRLGSVEGQYNSAISLGDLEAERNNYGGAARWYARAQSIAEGRGYHALQTESYSKLYEIYKRAGNTTQALQWLERFNELEDSLASDEKLRLQAEYETLFNIRTREQQAEIIEARQQEIHARVNLQQWLIVFAFSLGGFLLVVAFVLNRSNRKVKDVNSELEESNEKIREVNKTVKEQNDELEQVNQVKNKLFAIVAHDLRSPLSSLQSLIYLIREHDLSKSERNNILDSLDQNIQDNSNMMDNLLAWAKAQMNGVQLNRRVFKFSEAAKAVTEQVRFQAENKGISIETQVVDELTVKADYDIVKLVLRNLIANAIKFSKENDTITVSVSRSKQYAEIQIIDEGIGIKTEDQPKLFGNEHFTTRGTKNEKGSGLGLNLSKEYIEEHGGELWFESEYKVRTTFFFTLPLAEGSVNGTAVSDDHSLEDEREPIDQTKLN